MSRSPEETTPPFSFPLAINAIPARGKVWDISASPEQCAAVARLFAIPRISSLQTRLDVMPFGRDGAAVNGTVSANVTLVCVVSAEEFELAIEEPVAIRYSSDGVSPDAPVNIEDILADPDAEDPPDLLESDHIDLGVIATEFLALALPTYPQKSGSSFAIEEEEQSASPFSALAALRDGAKPDKPVKKK